MLDLIFDYENTRYQLHLRIKKLNQLLKSESLPTIERESLTVRRDLLSRERLELLENIMEMQKHLGKEELYLYAERKTHPVRSR